MTGDGVNDAAALRTADIGIAMGVTGTEVTKQAADMVLTDDNFATIVAAIERGRAIYDNIAKFVRFQLTTNLAAIGTLLTAGLVGLPSPLTAAQLLWVNIIADGPPAMSLGVDPPAHDTMHRPPRSPGDAILDTRRVLALLAPASVMAAGTLAVLVMATAAWGQAVALTMAFTTFVLFQLGNALNARTARDSVLGRDTFRNGKLWMALGAVAALQIVVVMAKPAQAIFGTTSLTPTQWCICLAVAPIVIITEETRKVIARSLTRQRRNTT
jgi:Ca2+-transporting ATPase